MLTSLIPGTANENTDVAKEQLNIAQLDNVKIRWEKISTVFPIAIRNVYSTRVTFWETEAVVEYN